MVDWNRHCSLTAQAMADPQPGDRYHEMWSFWLYVVARNGDQVCTMEASAPCSFPRDGKIVWQATEEFRRRWAYGSIEGYTVMLADRWNDVSGWLDAKGGNVE